MIETDLSDFHEALRSWADAAGKDTADACNLGAKSVIIGTAKETVKTAKGRIRSELNATATAKDGRSGPLKYLLTARKGQSRKEHADRAQKKVNARVRSAGYISIAVKLAGKPFGLYKNLRAGRGWATDSTGKTATAAGLTAEATMTISVPSGAEKKVPIEAGMRRATTKILEFALKNLERSARRFSAR